MPSSGILENSSSVFQMHVEQICPTGPFKISFTLPGEIDARMVTSTYLPGGILEVTVGKRVFPDTTPKMAGTDFRDIDGVDFRILMSSRSFDFYLRLRFSTRTLVGC
ncbi:hypothetical protein Q3G72_000014 [Acer saccharum]|nr:hypothetical protein Q3G72_000014 [Acer saccharum]